jgi:hypothetical protein
MSTLLDAEAVAPRRDRTEELPTTARAKRRTRTGRGRKALKVLGWIALVSVIVTLSVFLHLATDTGRQAAADLMGPILSGRVRGTAEVGGVTRLDFDGIEMTDFQVTSPGGERVISADRVVAEFGILESFRRGAVVLTPATMDGGEMRVTRGPEDRIDLVWAMEIPDDRVSIPVQIRDIHMMNMTMVFALPGVPGEVEMANVSGLVDMSLGHQFHCRMDRVQGFVNIPIVHIGFNRLEGRISSDVATPLVVRMALDLEVADPTMEIRYHAPATVGGHEGGHLAIALGADVPDEHHIGTRREED